MFSCEDVSERASDYLDRTLPVWDRVKLRAHLFICINCRRYVDQLSATIDLVRSRQWISPEPEAEDHVLAVVRALKTLSSPPPEA